jgi:hypothetical protein
MVDALREAAPKFLSRKLLATLFTLMGDVLTVWLCRHLDKELAIEVVHFVVPSMTTIVTAYLAAQGWVDKHTVTSEAVTADVATELEARARALRAEPTGPLPIRTDQPPAGPAPPAPVGVGPAR